MATSEKTILEEAQRNAVKLRIAQNETWVPRCFEFDPVTDSWHYRHADVRPWDQRNDVVQYESNLVIATKTRHRTPMIREASIVSVERQNESIRQQLAMSSPNGTEFRKVTAEQNTNGTGTVRRRNVDGSISSSAEGDQLHSSEEDTRLAGDKRQLRSGPTRYSYMMEYIVRGAFFIVTSFIKLDIVGITCCSTSKSHTERRRTNYTGCNAVYNR